MPEVGEPIEVCPECDQAGITQRHRTSGPQYRCPRCTHKFDTPRVRERRGNSTGGSGGTIPAKLAGMTPEEFDELRTDGGQHAEDGRATHRGRVLDLFCGVGGAARGLQDRCGYEVVGFDIEEQPKYPGEFHQRDLRDGLPSWVFEEEWAGVWASPPCTPFTSIEAFQSGENLIPLARQLVHAVPAGFRIIENVPGARDHLRDPTTLQGGAFSPPLGVQKERVFETNFRALSKTAPGASYAFCIGDRESPTFEYREAHGFAHDCELTAKELRECIPPVYVEYLVVRWMQHGESRQEVLLA